ncbi:membrane protein [Catellatospora methionotrophica]|uniref:Membrane protein n=1 Tax=Catellatospora methionotrophica TaxID=121620 RepID=A0A8J3L418_9ACTN|nr:DedA family protein [Catellatospora methionotrophica]GIG11692.1 membrane protein [Catellatospora methionotrophica]
MDEWITSVMDRLGVFGVGALIALETVLPPIPSEVILPLAGFQAHAGKLNPLAVWAAATVGALVGALALYALGAWLGYRRLHRLAHRRWFIIASPSDVERGRELFDRHGSWVVAAARCVPVLRSLVSLPAGMVRMPVLKFSALTLLGAGMWNAAFITAGWHLSERWEVVQRYGRPITIGVVVLLALALGWTVRRRIKQSTPAT